MDGKVLRVAAIAATWYALCLTPAHGASVVIEFTGTVTNVDDFQLPSSATLLGESGSGRIVHDDRPDAVRPAFNQTAYLFDTAPAVFSFQMPSAGLSFVTGSAPGNSVSNADGLDFSVDFGNDGFTPPRDEVRFFGTGIEQQLEGRDTRLLLAFFDSSATVLDSRDFRFLPDPTLFDTTILALQIASRTGTGVGPALDFSLDSITVTVVPLPAAFWMLLGGVSLLAVCRRRFS